jgi:hypothetical protein
MPLRRRSLIALGALVATTGCAASGRWTARPDASTPRVASPAAPVVNELVARINQNAAPVSGLTASTSVSVNKSHLGAGVSGQLALERPRNFKLALEKGLGTPVVDVGSNDREFWFWTKDQKDNAKAIYVGSYDARGAAPPDLLFQPDWIVEALGLRPIGRDEAARLKVERGQQAGTLVLTHQRDDGRGGVTIKRTVLDEATRQVRQHVFYAPGDPRNPVAVVVPSKVRAYALEGREPGEPAFKVELPQRLQLHLMATRDAKERVVMDVALSDIRLNPDFDESHREALFSVPEYSGYQVVHLNSNEPSYAAGRPSLRERERDEQAGPAVRLEEPAPIGTEGAWLLRQDPMPLEPDLRRPVGEPRPIGAQAIARPGIPRPPGTPDEAPSPPPRRVALGSGFEP